MQNIRNWAATGAPWVWLNAGAVAVSLVMVFGLLLLIAVRGLGHFWPADVRHFEYDPGDGTRAYLGEVVDRELVGSQRVRDSGIDLPATVGEEVERILIKTGNRDVSGLDFTWLLVPRIQSGTAPEDVVVLERREWGNFYGFLLDVQEGQTSVVDGGDPWPVLEQRLARVSGIYDQIEDIEKGEIGRINYDLERLRLRGRALELEGRADPATLADLEADRAALNVEYEALKQQLDSLYEQVRRDQVVMRIADGREVTLPMASLIEAWRPNAMHVLNKAWFYVHRLWVFVSTDPREANTEGGIFPAIFGTVMMVLLMSILVTPFGVVAAVYLREYAKQGPLTRLIRIAVNNLAGVPSIVYGVFGLGFFVYFLGSGIDRLFFPEALPAPTFGTPGLLWASLTLALLTLPVVIVATEEGLARIPSAIREGSLALGATKIETLWRTVLPMASPAMMTGLILAVARAAGEVAPLMLVGVVKLAPSLPLDGNFPFLHMERKFMHLGFHIYDVGFQSPNVEAARPLVYATSLLLVAIIVILNVAAIHIRNRLREKYRALEN